MDLTTVLRRRSDLSTFLVHFTRDSVDRTAADNLAQIIQDEQIVPGSPMGQAVKILERNRRPLDSQKCVSFTETPLEFAHLMVEEIEGRSVQLKPYGIAVPKRVGRKRGLNPVWYIDITPGHSWLTEPLNAMIEEQIATGEYQGSAISKLTPYIEQMGTGTGFRKEFWWEREWRSTGAFSLTGYIIGLCPQPEIPRFRRLAEQHEQFVIRFIDPNWNLEQIIARLAGIPLNDVDV